VVAAVTRSKARRLIVSKSASDERFPPAGTRRNGEPEPMNDVFQLEQARRLTAA
jgi:hypothetical protein